MSIIDYFNRHIPEYYPTMWMDGYTPTEIIIASRQRLLRQLEEMDQFDSIHITSEVKIKK